jgi:hypothetical protein
MYPHERSLVKQLADKPFALIGVNSDKDLEKIREVVKEKELTWRSFQNKREGQPDISKEWGVMGWPTIYVIDAKGMIRFKNVRGEMMDRALEKLFKEMGQEIKITHEEDRDENQPEAGDSGKNGTTTGSDDKPEREEDKDGVGELNSVATQLTAKHWQRNADRETALVQQLPINAS